MLGLALAAAGIAQQTPTGSAGSLAALPLVQVEHLVGDQYAGFSQSCLIVYSDGRYHRVDVFVGADHAPDTEAVLLSRSGLPH